MTAHDLVLRDVLLPHRGEALERWRGFVLDSYPEEAARFFRKEKDRFKNPVGQSIHRATETILDGALLERDAEGCPRPSRPSSASARSRSSRRRRRWPSSSC